MGYVLEVAQGDSAQKLNAAKYILDSKFGYSAKDQAPTTAVQINFTMPKPEELSTFLERTGAIVNGDDNE